MIKLRKEVSRPNYFIERVNRDFIIINGLIEVLGPHPILKDVDIAARRAVAQVFRQT